MAHPFRHDLEAALARIDQLESALADSRTPTSLGTLVWSKVRVPLMVGTVVGSLLGGVGFSSLLVAEVDEEAEPDFDMAADIADLNSDIANMRSQIVTVSPRGISALQVGDTASGHAAALNAACGGVHDATAVTLELHVAANGSVSRAQARGPEALARCTERVATTWTFPASDGATHATVPLYFSPNVATGARPVHLAAAANAAPAEMGSLAVTCMPACDTVLEDGVPLGRSPILAHPTAVGRHAIELISGTQRRLVHAQVHAHQLAEIRQDLSAPLEPETSAESMAPL